MKPVTIKKIKDELHYKSSQELIELCLLLSKFKKENKELLTYLLFDKDDEEMYINKVKEYITLLFDEINTKSFFTSEKVCVKYLSLQKNTYAIQK